MPNVSEKKLKLLYIAQLLLEKTDEDHAVTLPQMLEMLEAKGIPAERKSLYDDLETLRRFGFPIETRKSRTFAYYLSQRTFSPGDVALLAEAVRQAPGLSPRKVSQLLKKLGTLCSQYQAQALLQGSPVEEPPTQEETVPEPAAPSPEELLRRAIQRGVQVAFQAVTWELSSTGMALRQEEAVTASPWWLYCQDGALWLLATDTATGQARRFPLRQVSQVRLLPQAREGEEFLPAVEKFTLEFPQELLPQVASRFDGALALEHLGKARLRATGESSAGRGILRLAVLHGERRAPHQPQGRRRAAAGAGQSGGKSL